MRPGANQPHPTTLMANRTHRRLLEIDVKMTLSHIRGGGQNLATDCQGKKESLVECVKHSYRPQIGGMGGVALT